MVIRSSRVIEQDVQASLLAEELLRSCLHGVQVRQVELQPDAFMICSGFKVRDGCVGLVFTPRSNVNLGIL